MHRMKVAMAASRGPEQGPGVDKASGRRAGPLGDPKPGRLGVMVLELSPAIECGAPVLEGDLSNPDYLSPEVGCFRSLGSGRWCEVNSRSHRVAVARRCGHPPQPRRLSATRHYYTMHQRNN